MAKKRKKKRHWDWHHRKPRSLGKPQCCAVDDLCNMAHVTIASHRAWHTLFSNLEAKEIASLINRVWLDPDYHFVCFSNHGGLRYRRKVLYKDSINRIIHKVKK